MKINRAFKLTIVSAVLILSMAAFNNAAAQARRINRIKRDKIEDVRDRREDRRDRREDRRDRREDRRDRRH